MLERNLFMMRFKRTTCFLLASALMIGFAGCAKSEETEKKGAKNKVSEEKKDTENNVVAEDDFWLPKDLRFDGETFDLYIAIPTASQSFIAPEETGDQITDAVYQRNELVEKRLGVKLNFVGTSRTSSGEDQKLESNQIRTLIQGGDDTYDAYVHVQHGAMPTLIEEGLFVDWNELQYVNTDNPWWYSNVKRDICFGDKIYCMTGDYNFKSFASTACVAFNKTLCDELGLEYPYDAVFDGTWTHDMMVEYIKKSTKDLNGDGAITTEYDRYGYMGWQPEIYGDLYCGYGGNAIEKDDDNLPVLAMDNERMVTVVDKMIELFSNEGAYVEGKTYGLDDTMFAEGRLMFNDSFLSHIPGMRGYEDVDVGFVPYPKLDENQEEYYSRTAVTAGMTYIPVTNENLDMTGAVLETMAYYSGETIIDTYFDIILTIKSTRDTESEEMIPIIRNSARFMEQIIGFTGSNIVVNNQGNTISSFVAKHKDAWQGKIDGLRDFYS